MDKKKNVTVKDKSLESKLRSLIDHGNKKYSIA